MRIFHSISLIVCILQSFPSFGENPPKKVGKKHQIIFLQLDYLYIIARYRCDIMHCDKHTS